MSKQSDRGSDGGAAPTQIVWTGSMWKSLANRYATPFVTGLFMVSLISGVALFFHLGQSLFHGMHEWLSMVLIVPFLLHVWKNWAPLTSYLKRDWLVWPLAASLAMALAFAVPAMMSGSRGGSPVGGLVAASVGAKLSDVAAVLGKSPDAAVQALTAAGYKVGASSDTLAAIGQASGKSGQQALFALVAAK